MVDVIIEKLHSGKNPVFLVKTNKNTSFVVKLAKAPGNLDGCLEITSHLLPVIWGIVLDELAFCFPPIIGSFRSTHNNLGSLDDGFFGWSIMPPFERVRPSSLVTLSWG
jgi:hypothetical protein